MAEPLYNNHQLVANFIGADGDVAYTPELGSPFGAFVFTGNARLRTAVTLFGNSTLYVDGAGDKLTWGGQQQCQFLHDQTTDWTMEGWLYKPTLPSTQFAITSRGTACGAEMTTTATGVIAFNIRHNTIAGGTATSAAGVIIAATWHYYKVTFRNSDRLLQVRVDGILVASATVAVAQANVVSNLGLTFGAPAHTTTGQGEYYFGPTRISKQRLDDLDIPSAIFTVPAYVTPTEGAIDTYANNVEILSNFDAIAPNSQVYPAGLGPAAVFVGTPDPFIDLNTALNIHTNGGAVWFPGRNEAKHLLFGSDTDFNWMHQGEESWTLEIIFTPRGPTGTSAGALFDTRRRVSADDIGVVVNVAGTGSAFSVSAALGESLGVSTTVSFGLTYLIGVVYNHSTGNLYITRKLSSGAYAKSTEQLQTPIDTRDSKDAAVGWNRLSNVWFRGHIHAIRLTRGVIRDTNYWPAHSWNGTTPLSVILTAPFALQAAQLVGFSNFSNVVQGFSRPGVTMVRSQYYMEISGSPVLRVPISSWQSTRQLDRTQYLQCVVPAVDDYVSAIAARQGSSNFAIYRTATMPSGFVHNVKVAESLLESAAFSEGGKNYSCTLSGYPAGATAPTTPSSYELAGVRYIRENSTGTYVARCAIDWLLRPGDLVTVGAISFTADYINSFANDRDSYMDVGSR